MRGHQEKRQASRCSEADRVLCSHYHKTKKIVLQRDAKTHFSTRALNRPQSNPDNALLILKKIRPTLLIERQRKKNGC
jgi:hypothetical protein